MATPRSTAHVAIWSGSRKNSTDWCACLGAAVQPRIPSRSQWSHMGGKMLLCRCQDSFTSGSTPP